MLLARTINASACCLGGERLTAMLAHVRRTIEGQGDTLGVSEGLRPGEGLLACLSVPAPDSPASITPGRGARRAPRPRRGVSERSTGGWRLYRVMACSKWVRAAGNSPQRPLTPRCSLS